MHLMKTFPLRRGNTRARLCNQREGRRPSGSAGSCAGSLPSPEHGVERGKRQEMKLVGGKGGVGEDGEM